MTEENFIHADGFVENLFIRGGFFDRHLVKYKETFFLWGNFKEKIR